MHFLTLVLLFQNSLFTEKFIPEELLLFTTFVGILQVVPYITNCNKHIHIYI